MAMPNFQELVIIGGIVLILFGGKRLPQLGGALGEGIRNFRRGLDGKDEEKKELPKGSEKESVEKPSSQATPEKSETHDV